MIEPTDEMLQALLGRTAPRGLDALLAIINRDYQVQPRSRDNVGLCCLGYAPCEGRPGCGADREQNREMRQSMNADGEL